MQSMRLFNDNKVELYHGSSVEISSPDLNHSRKFLDFGSGFYLTQDNLMARKWAVTKTPAVLNIYSVDLTQLKCYRFQPNEEWLHFILSNRKQIPIKRDYSEFDVLIGPTADDKLYNALADYLEGNLSEEVTIKIINCMQFSNQYLFKTEKAVKSLMFKYSKYLIKKELQDTRLQMSQDRIQGSTLYKTLKQKYVGGTYYGQ